MLFLFVSHAYGRYTEVACRAAGVHARQVREHAKAARKELNRLRINQLSNIRRRLVKWKGLQTWKENDAWLIYHDSVKAANAERQKETCRILGRLISGRVRRATAVRFMRWKVAAAAAARSAVIDAASS